MGHKVNPKIFRMGIINTWNSKWFADPKSYIPQLRQDLAIKKFMMKKLKEAGVSKIEVERGTNKTIINAHVIKPGIVIGRSGSGVDDIKKELETKILNKSKTSVKGKQQIVINIIEVSNPGVDAQVVTDMVIADIEKRMPFRRVMKQTLARAEKAGALGVKVEISGRLNGAEIARTEKLSWGRLPLHTLRADIDYCRGSAWTTYGQIGVKVWIYRGEVFSKGPRANQAAVAAPVAPTKKK